MKKLFLKSVDLEYNQYLLLYQEKQAEQAMKQRALFPVYHQISEQVQELEKIAHSYENMKPFVVKEQEHAEIQDLLVCVKHSLDRLTFWKNQMEKLQEKIYAQMIAAPVGIIPEYKKEGFLFIHDQQIKEQHLFYYSAHIIKQQECRYADFYTQHLESFYGLAPQFKASLLKQEIIKRYSKQIAAPLFFVVALQEHIPVFETALPLSKQMVLQWTQSNT